ncbi:hypothetical protein GF340_02535 [Candidatus Peregrinibacteria bacterium]|nr:hypothetical protein [Candidatus Peregrinibacteria bacterium]
MNKIDDISQLQAEDLSRDELKDYVQDLCEIKEGLGLSIQDLNGKKVFLKGKRGTVNVETYARENHTAYYVHILWDDDDLDRLEDFGLDIIMVHPDEYYYGPDIVENDESYGKMALFEDMLECAGRGLNICMTDEESAENFYRTYDQIVEWFKQELAEKMSNMPFGVSEDDEITLSFKNEETGDTQAIGRKVKRASKYNL